MELYGFPWEFQKRENIELKIEIQIERERKGASCEVKDRK